MTTTPVLKIALPVPLRRLFDYLPLPGPLPAPGCRCLVPFGRRELVGIVMGVAPADTSYSPDKLLPVRRLLDTTPLLPPALLTLCQQAAAYYHQAIGEMLATALPVLLREDRQPDELVERRWRLTDRGRHVEAAQFGRASRQREAWEQLRQHPDGISTPAIHLLEISRATLASLAGKGWAEEIVMVPVPDTRRLIAEVPLTANAEQQAAITAITGTNGFQGFLLDGVTGSGKTEVYLQAAEKVLAEDRQVLVLVPEIGLTPQTLERFQNRFNRRVEALHSGMTDLQRLASWEAARQGQAAIIMGTRSALFTPLARPGLILVDEAHDSSFRQQEGCRYNARDLALWRGQLEQVPVVLGSATPSLETLMLARQGKLVSLPLTQRANAAPPHIRLEDCRQLAGGELLSPNSQQAIADCLAAGAQAMVFLNRRGYAPLITCLQCGWQRECPDCSRPMTWHRHARRLLCHHCERQLPIPRHCPVCGSSQLGDVGAGTEKLEEWLTDRFPSYPVIRIDRDATRRKGSLEASLALIRQGKPAILTGTQMLAKGHHFPQLELTVILDADAGFLSADFRGAEQAGQLVLQVAGRTGRGKQAGHVIIQTRHPDLPLLSLLTQNDWHLLAERLLDERAATGLPPFSHAVLFSAEATHGDAALAFLDQTRQRLENPPGLTLLGPVPAPLERRAGRFRFQLLVLAAGRGPLHQALAAVVPQLESLPASRRCRWNLDVDPLDML